MANVAWCPPGSDPALTAVTAPQGESLQWAEYLDLMEERVHRMLRQQDQAEARSQILQAIPQAQNLVHSPPNQWSHRLMNEGELIQDKLADAIPGNPWPTKVLHGNPEAKQALEQVDLPTWLNLAVPRDQN